MSIVLLFHFIYTQNEVETKVLETKIEDQPLIPSATSTTNHPSINEPNDVVRELSESCKFETKAEEGPMVQVPLLPADLAKKEEEDFNATYDVSVAHGAINDEKVRVEYLERGVEVMEPAEGDNIVHIVGMSF